jgi:hypothetical protein
MATYFYKCENPYSIINPQSFSKSEIESVILLAESIHGVKRDTRFPHYRGENNFLIELPENGISIKVDQIGVNLENKIIELANPNYYVRDSEKTGKFRPIKEF